MYLQLALALATAPPSPFWSAMFVIMWETECLTVSLHHNNHQLLLTNTMLARGLVFAW